MPTFFNGTTRPRIQVLAGFGGALDPGPTYIHLGVGPGLGTGLVSGPGAGTSEVDITDDIRSISLSQRGRSSDIDSASPVTCTIVLSNRHGYYDPSNPDTPYWSANRLTAEQESLEGGTTTGWEVGGSCTIASSTTVAHSGTRSLRLTSTAGSGGIWANTTTGAAGMPVAPGDAVKVSAWFRSATRSVTGIVGVLFWSADGGFIAQTNAAGVATSTSGWVQGSTTTVAPGGAATASVQVLYDSVIAVGEQHYADDILLQTTGLADGTPIRVRASWAGVAYDRFYGELADITLDLDLTPDATATFICLDGLEKLGRAYLPQTNPAMDGQTTGTRIGLLADQAAWPSSLRSIETGYTTLGRTVLGATALELMHAAESTEFGLLFADGAGRITFFDRHHPTTATRSTTVQATFADTTGAGKIGFQALALSRNRDRTFNRVAITRQAAPDEPSAGGGLDEPVGDTPVEQVADDPITQATKGVLSFPTEVGQLLRNDSEALAMAQYLVARFKVIANHIREIQVNALRGGWDVLLPLGPLDRVAVSRDYGPNTISMELHIQGLAEEIQMSPPAWQMTFSTTNPPPAADLWIVGTSQVGVDTLGW